MAGSYNHVISPSGDLASNQSVVSMLENGGDVYEAVEEMYGMIWYLAHLVGVAPHMPIEEFYSLEFSREAVKTMVETARQNYQEGLRISKEIHRLSPDRRRD